jgi:hypothetical protein
MPVPFQYPQGRISLVNSGKKQDCLCPRPLWDILARHSNDHLVKGVVEVLVCGVGPGSGMLVSKRKTKVLVCIGLQLQVHGSA